LQINFVFAIRVCAAGGEFVARFAEFDLIVCDGARVRSSPASAFVRQRKSQLNDTIFFARTRMARYVVVHSRGMLREFGRALECDAIGVGLMRS